MTEYRDAVADDIPAIDALFRRSFVDTFGHLYAPRDLAAFLCGFTAEAWGEEMATMRFRLAVIDGRPVGFAKLAALTMPVTPVGIARELRQLYLADEAKGVGVADTLLDWAVACARADGACEVFLSVFVGNGRARRFYERRGFVDIGRYDFAVGDHVDEDRLMRLTL